MSQRPTKLLHIDGIAHPVPEPVWAHFRFLSAPSGPCREVCGVAAEADEVAEVAAA